ncbi:MAG: PaaI family thioesterase [Vampirovibrionales bacterium]
MSSSFVAEPAIDEALLARIQAIPAVGHLAFTIESLSSGECVATMPRPKAMDGIFESYHGGLLATAADMAACFAILTLTPPNEAITTTDLAIRYLAPCLSAVRVRATVVKLGRTLCPTEVRLTDDSGKLVATATVTYMRLPHIPHQKT